MANPLQNGQKDGATFSVYLRQNQLEWLDKEAEKMGVSRSKFIELKTFPKSLQVLKNKKGNPKGSKTI